MSILDVEREANESLGEEEGRLEQDIDLAADQSDVEVDDDDAEPERSPVRLSIAVGFPTVAAAIMAGGIFSGASGRIYAAVAGLLGVGLAYAASKVKSTVTTYIVILLGLFVIAVAMVVPSGIENLASFGKLAKDAAGARGVLRPPVPLSAGWQFILGGLMAFIGFAAAWVALVVKKPAIGLLVPLPIAAISGISVPKVAQIPSGIACLALFAVGMGILATAAVASDDSEKPPLSYELRRAGKGLVFVVIISVVLAALSQTNFLFPKPVIDPTQEPQKPKTVPLSDVQDRVLFTVKADFRVPWRIGTLDVYNGIDWRTPPFAGNRIKAIDKSGVISNARANELKAEFTIAGLTGAVLPTLPNTAGVVARGPALSYDSRNQNLRLTNGQVQAGIAYQVVAPNFPKVDDLKAAGDSYPKDIVQFKTIPDSPPAVDDLLAQARQAGPDKFTQFFYLYKNILDTITVTGKGEPKDISPARVQEILASEKKEANPFEVVAMQAMLARWAGVPSRIGFGYDKCEQNGDVQECRPRHGALFVEVYFPGFDWLPVTGTPKKAKPSVGSKPSEQQVDPEVQPSDDIAIKLFLPAITQPASVLPQQILRAILIALPILALIYLAYVVFPLFQKSRARGRKRRVARLLGPRARVALAYTEWRDTCTDYGYRHQGDTPLMFLDRFTDDAEHAELAWLVTRCLWGDRQHDLTLADATACEELSRALRRRVSSAHPGTVKAIAAVSRLSQRHPYSPELDILLEGPSKRKEEPAHAVLQPV
jgi:hypothetical protein